MIMSMIIIIFLLIGVCSSQDSCRTSNGNSGTCILLENCVPLLEIQKKPIKTDADILFLRQSNCGLHLNIKPKVCCPPQKEWESFTTTKPRTFPTRRPGSQLGVTQRPNTTSISTIEFPDSSSQCPQTVQAPDKDSFCCGVQQSTLAIRITGGKTATTDEYPWLALIEYDWGATACGGSLISSLYVLTAAHCLGQTRSGTPVKVRLSEYNTTSYPTDMVESDGGGFENITVLIIDIEKQIVHPEYKYESVKGSIPHNDIGLIKLAKMVPYTDFIRPICLPFEDILSVKSKEGLKFTVAGWGSNGTTSSEVKQFVHVPYVRQEQCEIMFNELHSTHICAGGEKGKDSCGGDSGGPLMTDLGNTYILTGIVSFGSTNCGKEGLPAIYTNVYPYLSWIRKEMV